MRKIQGMIHPDKYNPLPLKKGTHLYSLLILETYKICIAKPT